MKAAPRKRIPAGDRKQLILAAARKVFAESGYEGAKTLAIATAAGVSEALVYRHFSSKEVLYRAVLRQLIREQDESYRRMYLPEPSTAGLVRSIRNYVELSLTTTDVHARDGLRLLVASLAGEGSYASLIYRRAQRKMYARLDAAMVAAREEGSIIGQPLSTMNAGMFQAYLVTMLTLLHDLPNSRELLDTEHLVRDTIWFCCRGLGMTGEAIRQHYTD